MLMWYKLLCDKCINRLHGIQNQPIRACRLFPSRSWFLCLSSQRSYPIAGTPLNDQKKNNSFTQFSQKMITQDICSCFYFRIVWSNYESLKFQRNWEVHELEDSGHQFYNSEWRYAWSGAQLESVLHEIQVLRMFSKEELERKICAG